MSYRDKSSNKQKRIYKMVDGSQMCSEKRRLGYCWCDAHYGFLSKRLLDEHECLKKRCPFLEKFKSHGFWINREMVTEKRERKKIIASEQEKILERFRELTCDIEALRRWG